MLNRNNRYFRPEDEDGINMDLHIQFAYAVRSGDNEKAKEIYGQGMTLDDLRCGNNYALRVTCGRGDLEMSEWIWCKGLTVDDVRCDNNYILRMACRRGDLEMVKWAWGKGLCALDLKPDVRSPKMFEWLCENGMSLEDLRSGPAHPLQEACQNGHPEIVKFILSKGVSLKDIRANNNSALQSACNLGYLEIVEILIKHGLRKKDFKVIDDLEIKKWALKRISRGR